MLASPATHALPVIDIGPAGRSDADFGHVAADLDRACAEPILHRFGVTATVRPSLAFYNTCEEVDTLTAALHRLVGQSGRR